MGKLLNIKKTCCQSCLIFKLFRFVISDCSRSFPVALVLIIKICFVRRNIGHCDVIKKAKLQTTEIKIFRIEIHTRNRRHRHLGLGHILKNTPSQFKDLGFQYILKDHHVRKSRTQAYRQAQSRRLDLDTDIYNLRLSARTRSRLDLEQIYLQAWITD